MNILHLHCKIKSMNFITKIKLIPITLLVMPLIMQAQTKSIVQTNILLRKSPLQYQAPPFNKIKDKDFLNLHLSMQ